MQSRFTKVIGASIIGLAFSTAASAADFNFKFAHSQPETSVRHKSMVMFKEKLEKGSNDRIKVELFASSSLGNEAEVMDMVKMGNVQGTRVAPLPRPTISSSSTRCRSCSTIRIPC